MIKRALGSVVRGFVLAVIVVAATDNPLVPNGIRFALSPGLLVAEHVTVHGNLGEQISKSLAIMFWVDVVFYAAMIFIVTSWLAHRRKQNGMGPPNERE